MQNWTRVESVQLLPAHPLLATRSHVFSLVSCYSQDTVNDLLSLVILLSLFY